MLTASFDSIVEDGNTVGKRVTIYYNDKVVTEFDFPPEAEMDQDQLDSYVASKLSGVMS
jgi:hypothetical protein